MSGGGLTAHYERKMDSFGEYIKFGNEEIDIERTHLNYNLAPPRNQTEFISKRLSEVYCLKRDNVNVMCTWLITAPKALQQHEHELFFKVAYEFLNERYAGNHKNDKNVVSAYVHMDETTPHMHYAFLPIVSDPKKGEKVSAKVALGWENQDLKQFHIDLAERMKFYFGRDIGMLNQATKDGNKTITELKTESKKAQATELAADELRADEIRNKISAEINDLQNREFDLRQEVEMLENHAEAAERKADRIIREKTLELDEIYEKTSTVLESQAQQIEDNEIKIQSQEQELTRFENFLAFIDKVFNSRHSERWKDFQKAMKEGKDYTIAKKDGSQHTARLKPPESPLRDPSFTKESLRETLRKTQQEAKNQLSGLPKQPQRKKDRGFER